MNYLSVSFFTGIMTVLTAQSALSQQSIVENVIECATLFDVDVDASVTDRVAEAVSGSVQLDLMDFIEIFPDDDKLDAYRIFDGCLARRYQTSANGQSLLIGQPISLLPTDCPPLENTETPFSIVLDHRSDGRRVKIPFSIQSICEVSFRFSGARDYGYYFDLYTRSGTEVFTLDLGRTQEHAERLGPECYVFSLYANEGSRAGLVEGTLSVQCN